MSSGTERMGRDPGPDFSGCVPGLDPGHRVRFFGELLGNGTGQRLALTAGADRTEAEFKDWRRGKS
jgi:hypothetical protein